MISIPIFFVILGSFMVPVLAVLCLGPVLRWRRERRRRRERSPISAMLLRPAGESLRLKVDELSECLNEQGTAAMIYPGVVLAVVLLTAPEGGVSQSRTATAFALCAALLLVLLWRVFQTLAKLEDYRLGFHGERAVAEELNQLMRDGCHVFHDVPMEPYGNIDHVVVSSAGVFAVETKTRRKRAVPKGKRDCNAVFDGVAVQFPTWPEVAMVSQAKMQAELLRAELTRACGEAVAVQAVLALPGWFVTSSVPPGPVRVLNPRAIRSIAVDPRAKRLTEVMIKRISHQLNEKCRTVEM